MMTLDRQRGELNGDGYMIRRGCAYGDSHPHHRTVGLNSWKPSTNQQSFVPLPPVLPPLPSLLPICDDLPTSSLSDLKEIGCKSGWLVYISPLFRPIEQLLAFKIVKIYPHPVTFSLRFFKSDRLLGKTQPQD
jgi:hypothetical protein